MQILEWKWGVESGHLSPRPSPSSQHPDPRERERERERERNDALSFFSLSFVLGTPHDTAQHSTSGCSRRAFCHLTALAARLRPMECVPRPVVAHRERKAETTAVCATRKRAPACWGGGGGGCSLLGADGWSPAAGAVTGRCASKQASAAVQSAQPQRPAGRQEGRKVCRLLMYVKYCHRHRLPAGQSMGGRISSAQIATNMNGRYLHRPPSNVSPSPGSSFRPDRDSGGGGGGNTIQGLGTLARGRGGGAADRIDTYLRPTVAARRNYIDRYCMRVGPPLPIRRSARRLLCM